MIRFLLCVVALAASLASQGPRLVRDINTKSYGFFSSTPAEFTRVGGLTFFRATSPLTGSELYATDGTKAGTKLVKDINAGGPSSIPTELTRLGNRLVFRAMTNKDGTELWVSDGSAAGTRLVTDLYVGATGSQPTGLVEHAGSVYFQAASSATGIELYAFDGRTLRLVKDIAPGNSSSHPSGMTSMFGKLWFSAQSSASQGHELWMSDGTTAGTKLVADLVPGTGSSRPHNFVALGSRMYFAAHTKTLGIELWTSDGTAAGSKLLLDIDPGAASSLPRRMRVIGKQLFFAARRWTPTHQGHTLFVSDGTKAGTRQVVDNAGVARVVNGEIREIDGRAWFSGYPAKTVTGQGTWATDGTNGSFRFMLPGWVLGDANGLVLWATARRDLHRLTNPKTGGSVQLYSQLRTIVMGEGPNGEALLSAGVNDLELWATAGTAATTRELKDIGNYGNRTQPSLPSFLTEYEGQLFFTARRDSNELWKSDGSAAGTQLQRDHRGRAIAATGPIAELDGRLFFTVLDPDIGFELYESDGTQKGTKPLVDINPGRFSSHPGEIVRIGERVFFAATTQKLGRELWTSDGTAKGTRLVKDLAVGLVGSGPRYLREFRGRLVFIANGALHISDGSASGTVRLAGGLVPWILGQTDKQFYFTAHTQATGNELWVSDGSVAGTRLVRDLAPGPASSFVRHGFCVNGRFVFRYRRAGRYEFWTTDGTSPGTQRLTSLEGRTLLGKHKDRVYLTVWKASSRVELHVSDGTPRGTRFVKDLGTAKSSPLFGMSVGERRFVFPARNPQGVPVLWESDGTSSGTRIWYSAVQATPFWGRLVKGRLMFSGFDDVHSTELWAIDDPGASAARVGAGCGASGEPALASEAPVLGRAASIRGDNAPLQSIGTLVLGVRAAKSIALGGFCRSYVDLFAPILAPSPFVVQKSSWQAAMTLPNSAALQGLEVALQAFYFGGAQLQASNGLHWRLGR